MKKILSITIILTLGILSCKNETDKGRFNISGELKNTADQKIYLDQIYLSDDAPQVLDTGEVKNGKFELSAVALEEGLFRVRFEKLESGFIFINDKPQINIKADTKNPVWEEIVYNTPANTRLKKFLKEVSERMMQGQKIFDTLQIIKNGGNNDSLITMKTLRLQQTEKGFQDYIFDYIHNEPSPMLSMFAFGYTKNFDPQKLSVIVTNLTKRFPDHQGLASFILYYNQQSAQQTKQPPANSMPPQIGNIAPDFTMNDTSGQPFSLKQLKGKYVLVDFWASWCGPCRGENPNVVAAYNKYKDKNFTILGVSLDENKGAWLKAIKDDNLAWQQVSDLKGWNSASVPLYGFDGIPYNVLIDAEGKIIATTLRGQALDSKLEEILK